MNTTEDSNFDKPVSAIGCQSCHRSAVFISGDNKLFVKRWYNYRCKCGSKLTKIVSNQLDDLHYSPSNQQGNRN